MKNHRTDRSDIIVMPRNRCWIGAGLTSSALLAGCIESEEDLIADSVLASGTTFVTDKGDRGESSGDETAGIDAEDGGRSALSEDRADLPPFVPYEAIVKFRVRAPASARINLAARAQIEGITDDTSLVRFAVDAGGRRGADDEIAATWALIDELRERGDIEYAHPNWLFALSLAPNDTQYPQQWHYPQVNLPAAWDLTTGASTVRIAIIDTGRTGHPDFAGRWLASVEYDATNEDGDARSKSAWNHGVAVAGVAGGATNNSANTAGVCSDCSLLDVNAESGGMINTAAAVRGIYWAVDNGARVINMSFEASSACTDVAMPAMKAAIAYAASKNVTVVAAAGNAGKDAKDTSPASCPGVISVAATDKNKALAQYSNHGQVTLAAPGGAASLAAGKIGADAYGKALGVGCDADPASQFGASTAGVVTNWTTKTGKHCDRHLSGTSLAAPHVAGVVGLMLSRNPSLTPAQIRQILQSTAQPACGGKCGAGLLDANAAVRQAAPLPVNDPKPTASFTVQCLGLQCTFNGGGSTDNGGIVAYEWILPGQQFRLGAVVNGFMPGYGSKSALLRVTDNRGQSTVLTKNFSIAQPSVTPVAGQYHNPARPDNRIDVYETSDSGLVVNWYTFDKSGNTVWYNSDPGLRSGARWTQPLRKSSRTNGVTTSTIVGSVWLDFSSNSEVWFSWVLDGVAGGERFSHLFGGQGRSGAWYMPADPGWGFSVHESGQQLETAMGFFTGVGPTWARSQRVATGTSLSIPMTVYRGKGLCPSCGGKTAAVPDAGLKPSMTLQIASGSATSGNASTSVIAVANYTDIWKKPLQQIQIVTKP